MSQKRVNKIIKDIKSIKIQGATSVAKEGVRAFLMEPTKSNARRIMNARATEPLLQNAIKILMRCNNKKKFADKFFEEIYSAHETISKLGSNLIKKDMNIYVHCHSSTVIEILKRAKKRRRKFVVYTTEVEPFLQGRMTARDLSEQGIHVVVGPDLSAEQILEKCDLLLFGADAFTGRALYNKIGTETLCRLAQQFNIPTYSCGISLKYCRSIKIEQRSGREVWDDRDKKIDVIYPAFDKVNYKLVDGIISELGILKPKQFAREAKKKLKLLRAETV